MHVHIEQLVARACVVGGCSARDAFATWIAFWCETAAVFAFIYDSDQACFSCGRSSISPLSVRSHHGQDLREVSLPLRRCADDATSERPYAAAPW